MNRRHFTGMIVLHFSIFLLWTFFLYHVMMTVNLLCRNRWSILMLILEMMCFHVSKSLATMLFKSWLYKNIHIMPALGIILTWVNCIKSLSLLLQKLSPLCHDAICIFKQLVVQGSHTYCYFLLRIMHVSTVYAGTMSQTFLPLAAVVGPQRN